jgi:hypothetical protein
MEGLATTRVALGAGLVSPTLHPSAPGRSAVRANTGSTAARAWERDIVTAAIVRLQTAKLYRGATRRARRSVRRRRARDDLVEGGEDRRGRRPRSP